MNARLILVAVLLLALAPAASAQIHLDPDGLGIYFDPYGASYCDQTSAPFEGITAYLLIVRPTSPSGVGGWEALVNVAGSVVAPAWTLTEGVNEAPAGAGFRVELDPLISCLPRGPVVHLATYTAFVMNAGAPIAFSVIDSPAPYWFSGGPGYVSCTLPYELYPLTPTFAPSAEVAWVNDCPDDIVHPAPVYPQLLVEIAADNGQSAQSAVTCGSRAVYPEDGWDESDTLADPPPPADFVHLVIPHPEWAIPEGQDFAADWRADFDLQAEFREWPLRLTTDRTDLPVTLTLETAVREAWPAEILLLDPLRGETVTLNDWQRTYTFTPDADGEDEFFLVVNPPSASAAETSPDAIAELTAYPNPFNPTVELAFTAPRRGRAEVRIHDARGRLVRRLDLGAVGSGERGTITWNGRDDAGREVGAGAYVAGLLVDGRGTGAVRRLALIR